MVSVYMCAKIQDNLAPFIKLWKQLNIIMALNQAKDYLSLDLMMQLLFSVRTTDLYVK